MSFHTILEMITKCDSKPIPVKVDPGADVNTKHLANTGNSSQYTLLMQAT